MTEMLDLFPAARMMTEVIAGIRDDQLTARTPCRDATLGDLLDHIGGLSVAFTAAAMKELGEITARPPIPSAANLGDDWRSRIPAQVAALAHAWHDPAAWTGTTQAGGLDLPGRIAGLVALDELVIHGWDLAAAAGLPYRCDEASIAACTAFASTVTAEQRAEGGLFGPAVTVPDDATALQRLIGMTGRDPSWTPPREAA
ncbi:TIGR03086 family metal-binding protein [Rhodococcus phenolicus]|uniref:TIGR03086 family metal-binding protein n=1 Tax=Rhodococcus phenolicus TaxID=263849 RepID=UPI00082E1F40|nr:TIGR03086 family metal-binding protein [Rhodococcus phenolicus]